MNKYFYGCFKCGTRSEQEIPHSQAFLVCPVCVTQNSVSALLHDDIIKTNQKIKNLESELKQQRFNNTHNLSIDQKVADEITALNLSREPMVEINCRQERNHFKEIQNLNTKNEKLTERVKELDEGVI